MHFVLLHSSSSSCASSSSSSSPCEFLATLVLIPPQAWDSCFFSCCSLKFCVRCMYVVELFFPLFFLVFFSVFDSDRNAFMGVCMYVCFTTFAIWGNVVKLRSWCPLRSLHNSCDPLVYVITSARKTSATQDRQKDKQTTETTETTERVVLGCWFSCPGCERSVELLHRNKQNRS